MISFGSIEHSNFEMLSTIEPAAPSDEAPAVSPPKSRAIYSLIKSTDQWGMLGYYSG
jgi:hypothetical protein